MRIETIRRPGATRSGLGADPYVVPQAENQASSSSDTLTDPRSSVAPTVMTYGSVPGVWTVPWSGPSLPAATTTTRPRFQAISTAAASGSVR